VGEVLDTYQWPGVSQVTKWGVLDAHQVLRDSQVTKWGRF